jgi:hypothetical protein
MFYLLVGGEMSSSSCADACCGLGDRFDSWQWIGSAYQNPVKSVHSEEIHGLCSSSSIMRMVSYNEVVKVYSRMEKIKNVHNFFVENVKRRWRYHL